MLPFELPYYVKSSLELVSLREGLESSNYVVFNPTNNSIKPLPALILPSCHIYSVDIVYVSSTDQYKVLCISGGRAIGNFLTKVFTLGIDRNWRDVDRNLAASVDFTSSTTVDHSIYYFEDDNDAVNKVYKFDVECEEWSMLPLPFTLDEGVWDIKEVGGRLCLVGVDPDINVWILKDFDNYSWDKEYHIGMASLLRHNMEYFLNVHLLNIEKDGRLLIFYNDNKQEPKIMYYDPRNKDFEDIVCLREKLFLGCGDYIFEPPSLYVDSLLS